MSLPTRLGTTVGFIHNSTLLGRFVNRPYAVVHRCFAVQIFAGRRDADPYAGRCVAVGFVQNSTLLGRFVNRPYEVGALPLSLCKFLRADEGIRPYGIVPVGFCRTLRALRESPLQVLETVLSVVPTSFSCFNFFLK